MSYRNVSHTVENITTRADTSFVKQAIGTTLTALNDTEVTYTPATGAKAVVYECDCTIAWSPDATGSYMCARLQYSTDGGSTWNTYAGSQIFAGNNSSAGDYNWHAYNFAFQVPAWTGARDLRITARAHTTSTEFTWGRQYLIPASEGAGATPIITVMSLMV